MGTRCCELSAPLSTSFGNSIPTTAYQTFLLVLNSKKLGRACNSDVYSVLRTVFLRTVPGTRRMEERLHRYTTLFVHAFELSKTICMVAVAQFAYQSERTYMCFYDLQKPFDSVQYLILLKHLCEAGING